MESESDMFGFFLCHFLFFRVPHSTGLNFFYRFILYIYYAYINVTKHSF